MSESQRRKDSLSLMPMYFAGARILEVFQVGVVQGNITVSVGVLSYAGQLNFDVVGHADAVPDLAVFAAGGCRLPDRSRIGERHRQLVAL
jgi:diacylglycerol O-acyltransferase / wax synthase